MTSYDETQLMDDFHRVCALPTIETQLAAWIDFLTRHDTGRCGPIPYNIMLESVGFRVYVAKHIDIFEGQMYTFLRIANVSIPEEYRGRGWFSNFRKIAAALNPWDGIYYESIVNERLVYYFEHHQLTRKDAILPFSGKIIEGSPSFIEWKQQ